MPSSPLRSFGCRNWSDDAGNNHCITMLFVEYLRETSDMRHKEGGAMLFLFRSATLVAAVLSASLQVAAAACSLDTIEDCTKRDPASAEKLLIGAIANGDKDRLTELGAFYRDAPAPYRDVPKAVSVFEKAAAANQPWGMLGLAELLAKDDSVAANPARAVRLFEEAANVGLAGPALNALGNYYLRAKETAKAKAAFERASAAGEPWGMLTLAKMLIEGEGDAADRDRAFILFDKAARTGLNGPVRLAIGNYYLSVGDIDKARAAFDEAAAAGEPWAMLALANILSGGDNISAGDRDVALKLFEQAAVSGLVGPARNALGQYYWRLSEFAKAKAAFEESVAVGEPWGMLSLAEMLANGEGSEANPARAVALYEQAASVGLTGPARNALGNYYLRAGDEQKAQVSFQQAADAGEPWAKLALAKMLAEKKEETNRQRASRILEELRQDKFVAAYPSLVAMEAKDFDNRTSMRRSVDLLKESFLIDRETALNAFRWLMPNDRVAVVQTALDGQGIYNGRINGLLTRNTLKSIARFCESVGIVKQCRSEALPGALLEKLMQQPDV